MEELGEADRQDADDASPAVTLNEVRWSRLTELLTAWFGGDVSELAEAVERDAAYLKRFLKGRRSIGDKLADHVERRLDLPVGWLSDNDNVGSVIRTVVLALPESDQDEVLAFVESRFRTSLEASLNEPKRTRLRMMLDRVKSDREKPQE